MFMYIMDKIGASQADVMGLLMVISLFMVVFNICVWILKEKYRLANIDLELNDYSMSEKMVELANTVNRLEQNLKDSKAKNSSLIIENGELKVEVQNQIRKSLKMSNELTWYETLVRAHSAELYVNLKNKVRVQMGVQGGMDGMDMMDEMDGMDSLTIELDAMDR